MTANYQFSTTITPPKKTAILYAITPHHSVEVLSSQHILLSHTVAQKVLVLEHYLTTVIETLKIFRSLEEHIKKIKYFMGLGDESDGEIYQVIKQLKDSGFLVTGQEALEKIRAGSGDQPIEEPPVVVIRTKGRVAMLKRLIISAQANEQQFNARYQYLFIDESTPEQAQANAVNIEQSSLNAQHIDQAKQATLLKKLQEQFPEAKESLDFLLGEHPLHQISATYGRSWNWGILLTAGKPAVFLDDDCLLQAYAPPVTTTPTVAFGKKSQSVHFLDKGKPLNEQLQQLAIDPIDQLAVVLGLAPKQLTCDEQSFDNIESDKIEQLQKSQIVMSTQAVAGDTGSDSPMWLYYLEGPSAQAFIGSSEADYQRHKTERFMWLGNNQPLVGLGENYSVVSRALDNRQLLPPTLPILRNEDVLFANLVHCLYPQACTYDMTWALAHLPEIERQWRPQQSLKPKGFDTAIAIDSVIADLIDLSGSAEDKLKMLSAELNTVLDGEEKDYLAWMYRQQQAGRAAVICQLNYTLENNPKMPDYWKEDVKAMMQANMPKAPTLLTSGETPAEMRAVLQAFAQSLSFWGDIWQYARLQTDELLGNSL